VPKQEEHVIPDLTLGSRNYRDWIPACAGMTYAPCGDDISPAYAGTTFFANIAPSALNI